jgi:hypothetical protein
MVTKALFHCADPRDHDAAIFAVTMARYAHRCSSYRWAAKAGVHENVRNSFRIARAR